MAISKVMQLLKDRYGVQFYTIPNGVKLKSNRTVFPSMEGVGVPEFAPLDKMTPMDMELGTGDETGLYEPDDSGIY